MTVPWAWEGLSAVGSQVAGVGEGRGRAVGRQALWPVKRWERCGWLGVQERVPGWCSAAGSRRSLRCRSGGQGCRALRPKRTETVAASQNTPHARGASLPSGNVSQPHGLSLAARCPACCPRRLLLVRGAGRRSSCRRILRTTAGTGLTIMALGAKQMAVLPLGPWEVGKWCRSFVAWSGLVGGSSPPVCFGREARQP